MRLVSLNVAIKINNTKKVVDYLKKVNPDFICLQEVARPLEKSVYATYRSQEVIDKILAKKYPYKFFVPFWVADSFRKGRKKYFRRFGGMIEQGSYILSKYPIIFGESKFYYKDYEWALDWSNWRQVDHARTLQVVEVKVKGKILRLLNLHGIFTGDRMGDKRTLQECRFIAKIAKEKKVPVIIAGDFNLQPQSPSMQILNRQFKNLILANNITATRPRHLISDGWDKTGKVVDYILVNNLVKVKKFKVDQVVISDHLPLILEFNI
jgi:endonuclease/exonuclease/phosphatase family metal-dependent hydrolase